MSTEQRSGYVNNSVDGGFTNLSDSVQYDECLENVDKSDYDQLSPVKDGLNHDYIILTSSLKAKSKRSDNEVHQKNKSLLRPIFFMMCCILISAGVTAAATFFATKHLYSDNRDKQTDFTQCNMSSDSPGTCLIKPCENGGTYVNTICVCQDGFAGSKCEIDVNQTCSADADTFIPHPNTCQLFYNCSQAVSPLPKYGNYPFRPNISRPAYLHECPYPELFSMKTMSCQNYTDVKCGSRYETKNACDYLAIGYPCISACKECIYFTPDCVGLADGVYENIYLSLRGTYFECKDERNIYNGRTPCPITTAPYNGECRDLWEIPTNLYPGIGLAVNCDGRENGNYKNERYQRCNIYHTCVNGISSLSHCDSGKVFDSKSSFCQNSTNACSPCGSVVNGC